MTSIIARNVNEALPIAMQHFSSVKRELELSGESSCPRGRIVSPRGQETIELNGPIITTYKEPRERVLFLPMRNANPFFHLMESLWILNGDNDVAFLAFFNANMKNYSDDGNVFHAPYGYRLRYSRSMATLRRAVIDQIETACHMLKSDPDSRQVVMEIWDSGYDLNAESKDIPCNDLIFLKIREGKLNITVCNRSNDVIWGAYGANVVQFSMLQEYMAAKIGVEVGVYSQVSDSFHVYTKDNSGSMLERLLKQRVPYDLYSDGIAEPYRLVSIDPQEWDKQLKEFMVVARKTISSKTLVTYSTVGEFDPFFKNVAIPMLNSYMLHKLKQPEQAFNWVAMIAAPDWRIACRQWLERRL